MSYNDFLMRVMSDDTTKHEFTLREKVVYGVLVPIGFFIVMCVCGWLENTCMR